MKRYLLAAAMATTALTILSGSGVAQGIDPSFQSPDQATNPSFAASQPNGGVPIPGIAAITQLGRTFGFGSSSTDTRSSVPVFPGYGDRFSNGNVNYIELLSPIIGATNRSGATSPLASPTPTNFAQAGTTSLTALPQVTQFANAYSRFNTNDLAVVLSGINDWSGGNVTAANYQSIAAANIANQTTMVGQLLNLGARNIVVLGQAPFGTLQYFTVPRANGIGGDGNAINAGARLVDQGLLPNLVALHNQSGANIRFFDFNMFINEIRANPTAYGYSVAGVQPGVNCFSLLGLTKASCSPNASFAEQNQYLSWDGIHYTYRFHTELAQVLANQIIAPYTMAPQTVMGTSTASSFSSSLLLRLDSYRTQDGAAATQTSVRPFSLFIEGDYTNANRDTHPGGPGLGNDPGSLTVGGEYRINPNLMVGGAFNYASPTVRLTNLGEAGNSRTSLDAYQFAAFASFNQPNWYVNGTVGGGFDDYRTRRSGLVDQLRASTSGNTLFAAAKGVYLFDAPGFRVGPVGSLSYSKAWVDSYSERGDPLLTQSVNGQSADSLVGSIGIQVRKPFTLANHVVSPFVNLTAEREFLGGRRSIVTAQTYALDLPSSTVIRGYGGGTYGKVAAGASTELGGGFSAMINGSATFARNNGDNYLLNGGVKYSF